MKRFQRATLVASTLALFAAHRALAELPRPRSGYASGGTVDTHEILVPTEGGREPINRSNAPSRLHPALKGNALLFQTGPAEGETTRSIFPANWWPMKSEGIAARWNSRFRDYEDMRDLQNVSPAEKYDLLMFPGQTTRVPAIRNRRELFVVGPTTAWELRNHGTYQSQVPESWWGHCNGWSSYVMAEPDGAPRHDIRVRMDGGRLLRCGSDDAGCILFRMGDLEALFTEVYFHDASTMAGNRCSLEENRTPRDGIGRALDPACRDLNPGTLHVALTSILGRGVAPLSALESSPAKLPFGMDYSAGNEVWTFPIVRYRVNDMEEIDEPRASALVCAGSGPRAGCQVYAWNENAVRFARVRTSVWLVNYSVGNEVLLQPPAARRRALAEATYHYVLELDGRGTILGGEWIDAPTQIGPNSKEIHPDFLFMSAFPDASDEGSDDRGGRGDNPYISYPVLKALLSLAQAPESP